MNAALRRPTRRGLAVLLVVDSLDVGGAEKHVVGLANALLGAGHSPTIACSSEGALAAVARRAGIRVCPLLGHLVKRRVSPGFAARLARLIRAERPDLVHAHQYASAAAAALGLLGARRPLVLTEHSEANWRTAGARSVSRLVYGRASRVIAVSESIRRRLLKIDGVRPERAVVIANAVLPLCEPEPPDQPPALPFDPGPGPLVGVVSRLQPEKGVHYFVQAAARVSNGLPSARFVVIGDGPLRQTLVDLAGQIGLRDRLHFLGFRLDAATLIRRLDLLVVPSLSEGTPLIVLEAMQTGVPVVASAVGGIPEQITHGCEGWLVPAADSGALADAMLYLLRNPERGRQLADAARRRLEACFRAAGLLRQVEAIYQDAVASGC